MTKKYTTIIITIIIIFFNIIVFKFPKEIISSSSRGLHIWYKNLVPSLLPFIFLNNFARETGVFHFLGNLLCTPISKILKISNISSISYISALFSGYPIGSKLVSDNYNDNSISKNEAQYVALFSNIASPLFIVGTVGSTLLNNKSFGLYILTLQIISSFIMGYFLSFFHRDFFESGAKTPKLSPVSQVLSQCISNSILTVSIIGCYVVLLSIVSEVFVLTGIMKVLSSILSFFLVPLGFNEIHSVSLIIGFFEMTSGIVYLVENVDISLQSVAIINGVLAFGGLSVNTQCISFFNKIEISGLKFLVFKLLQSVISIVFTYLTYNFFF